MAGLDLGMRFLSYAALWKCQCKLGVTFATVTADCFYFNGLPQDIQQERMRASTVATRGSAGWTRHDYLIIQKSNAFRSEGGKRGLRQKKTRQAGWSDRFEEKQACFLQTELGVAQGLNCYKPLACLGHGVEVRSPATCRESGSRNRRPSIPDLRRNCEVLQMELRTFIAEYGRPGLMPMRHELRKHGRVDLEKAIALMGGPVKVAERMELSLAYKQRKPRGYWDELENISREILLFQDEHGMDSKIMPTRRSFEKAGRYDLARAFEKWGGLREVANHLGLHVRWRLKRQQFTFDVPGQTMVSSSNGSTEPHLNLPMKTALPPTSKKWLTVQRE